MKLEKVIGNIKAELDSLNIKHSENIAIQLSNVEKLTKESSVFDNNWIGQWASNSFNYYHNFTNKSGGDTLVIDETDIEQYVEKGSGIKFNETENEVQQLSKAYREFQTKLITELSIIKGKENLKSEIDLLNEIELHKWGISFLDYIKMKRPKSIYTYDPIAVMNKGLETPPHISFGGRLISLFSTLSAIEDFQKNAKRIIRQIELKLQLDIDNISKEEFIPKLLNSFHNVAKQLNNRYNNRDTLTIKDEYDVQDLLNSLLWIEFDDIRPEEYTPSYAGSSTRMDFLLKKEKTVIEIKKTRDGLRDKEVGDQLILDSQHYKSHPDCKKLICFVYDPENKILNPRGLESDLNKLSSEDLNVEVYIRP